MNDRRNKINKRGAALLVVLFIVMAITILSLGFLSRSDVELACGGNMILRTQMDYLAESGLEHAKGLILNPQDVNSAYWIGANGLQIVENSNDYYNVTVEPNTVRSGSTLWCNYDITCTAYRLKGGQQVGRSRLEAELRLDPCIAYWAGSGTTISQSVTINGDVYCNGSLTNNGNIYGDVFAANLTGPMDGQLYPKEQLSVSWPGLNVSDFSSQYYVESTSYAVQDINSDISNTPPFEPSGDNPAGVRYCNSSMRLAGNVNINGMLVVNGTLRISGVNNVISAVKNFPAFLVEGEVVIEDGAGLSVEGLALIRQQMVVDANSSNVNVDIAGGLFIENGGIEFGSSASGAINITAAPSMASIQTWPAPGTARRWCPAAGAFFRSIRRN